MGYKLIELFKALVVILDPDILKDIPDPDKTDWYYK